MIDKTGARQGQFALTGEQRGVACAAAGSLPELILLTLLRGREVNLKTLAQQGVGPRLIRALGDAERVTGYDEVVKGTSDIDDRFFIQETRKIR